jgi:predicted Zn-ribbon and HTH transcriptional regulator
MHPAACAPFGEGAPTRARYELADVFRRYGEAYRATHPLPASHLRVMADIEACRTAALGGHLERCTTCGFERPAYDSCRNRHCPKCQRFAKEKWLAAQQQQLLPVPYFHTVFTLPHELNPLLLTNLRPGVDLLFHSASQTLLTFGRNELGATLGFLAMLHTWDQQLRAHFHLHCLVPAGALSLDRSRWVATPSEQKFLFPLPALAEVFRGKFLAGLKSAYRMGELHFPGAAAPWADAEAFQTLLDELYAKRWVLYVKRPLDGPQRVLDYLARYTHRVAISNHRILDVGEGHVRFSYRDRRHDNVLRSTNLPPAEFIRRFLLHVLPKGLMRIRRYGFLANRLKPQLLPICRTLLGEPSLATDAELSPAETRARLLQRMGIDPTRCPKCHNPTLVRAGPLPPIGRWPRGPPAPRVAVSEPS